MNARLVRTVVALTATAAVAAAGASTLASTASAHPAPTPAVVTSKDHGRTDFGYIAGTFTRHGVRYLRFDRAVMLTGVAAARAKVAHGIDPAEPPDYYIQNDNPRLRTYAVAGNVQVYGSQVLAGSPAPQRVTMATLVDHLRAHPGAKYPPFTLTFRNGKVVRIAEVYLA